MTHPLVQVVLFTSVAGLAMPAGAMLAVHERIGPRWLESELRHTIIAFGGGVLLAAVSLVLVPQGSAALPLPWVAVSFLLGGLAFLALAPLGPLCGLAGYFWLAAFPGAVAAVMLFAAGGILYLTFQDIAPQAKLENRYAPAIGAVAGFLLGLVGHALTTAG